MVDDEAFMIDPVDVVVVEVVVVVEELSTVVIGVPLTKLPFE